MTFPDLISGLDRAVKEHLGGITITYKPKVGAAVQVTAMLDDPYLLVENGQHGVEQIAPAVWVKLADLPVNPDDDTPIVTAQGRTYRVKERQLDSTGESVKLTLQRADV